MKALLAAATLLACLPIPRGWAETGISSSEITIGSCSPLQGTLGYMGRQQIEGAEAYLNYVNAQGGVHGRKIKLLSYDDGYDPDLAINCFNRLIQEEVFAGAFFVGAPAAAKFVTMAEENKIPCVGFTTGAQFLYEPFKRYVFATRASYFEEIEGIVDHLWQDLGMRRIAIIYQDDAQGASNLAGLQDALAKRGSAAVAVGSYSRENANVDQAIALVKAAKPEAVLLTGTAGPTSEIVKKARASGWNPLFVSTFWTDAHIQAAGAAGEGVIATQVVPTPSHIELRSVALFRKLMRKEETEEHSTIRQLVGFVSAMILVEGLKRAGPEPTREKLVDAIESIHDFDLGLGADFRAHFSKTRHQAFDHVYFTIVRSGKLVGIRNWKEARPSASTIHATR